MCQKCDSFPKLFSSLTSETIGLHNICGFNQLHTTTAIITWLGIWFHSWLAFYSTDHQMWKLDSKQYFLMQIGSLIQVFSFSSIEVYPFCHYVKCQVLGNNQGCRKEAFESVCVWGGVSQQAPHPPTPLPPTSQESFLHPYTSIISVPTN